MPKSTHLCAEHVETVGVSRYRVVVEVTLHDRFEPCPGLRNGFVHTLAELLLNLLQLCPHALAKKKVNFVLDADIRGFFLLQEQDRIIRTFPEVDTVVGTIGRSDSATDNAPLDMYDTTIMLKPREKWRPGMTYEKLVQEMDAKLQFPGLSNTWTMPVENRLDMELTGIKTPLGMKVQGPTF